MSDFNDIHVPVLLERSLELLLPALSGPAPILVDATLGMGGHAEALLRAVPALTVIGLDRDRQALSIAAQRLAEFGQRLRPVHAVYDELPEVLVQQGVAGVDGILFDLGVSSLQLDEAERGFAYAKDAPLDMRMDQDDELTAERILAEYDETALRRIFHEYGEEKLAARYARAIVRQRADAAFRTTGQLVECIAAATPAAVQRTGHPAKRVFQALRIEVNQELAVLARAIPAAIGALNLGGRIVVLSYQSLEDRIVKRQFQTLAASSTPAGLPVELPEHAAELRLLVRGAELADEDEIARNRRATPVRLRAAERIRQVGR